VCVVLLGWAHGLAKHVNKYAQLYSMLGYDAIQILGVHEMRESPSIPKAHSALTQLQLRKESYEKISEGRANKPLWCFITHSFSNGGLRIHIRMLQFLFEQKQYSNLTNCLRGAIYDSCPAAYGAANMANAVTGHMPKGCLRSICFWLCCCCVMPSAQWFSRICCCSGINKRLKFELIKKHPLQQHIPHLYIYSEADEVTNYSFLDEFIIQHRKFAASIPTVSTSMPLFGHDDQKELNSGPKTEMIDALRFTDTSHVTHYKKHPEEYTAAVTRFLTRVQPPTSKS